MKLPKEKNVTMLLNNLLDQETVMPTLISSNQSSFVKGRNIVENVLLTQEIATDITKRGNQQMPLSS